jgi:putative transposase
MPGKAAKTIITERQQEILQSLAFARGSPQGLAHRAEIILLAFDGLKNEAIARKLQCERHGVGIWRRRWQKYFDQLAVIECVEKPTALREAILEVLSDLPRAGCGGKFTPDEIARILATACEPPEKSGRPISQWTARELADEVVKRQIVSSISVRQVGRFLKDSGTSTAQEPLLAQRRGEGPRRFRRAGVRGVCDVPSRSRTFEKRGHSYGLRR